MKLLVPDAPPENLAHDAVKLIIHHIKHPKEVELQTREFMVIAKRGGVQPTNITVTIIPLTPEGAKFDPHLPLVKTGLGASEASAVPAYAHGVNSEGLNPPGPKYF